MQANVCFSQGNFLLLVVLFLSIVAFGANILYGRQKALSREVEEELKQRYQQEKNLWQNRQEAYQETYREPPPQRSPTLAHFPVQVPVPVAVPPRYYENTGTGPRKTYVSMYDTQHFHEVGYIQSNDDAHLRMRLYGRRKFPGAERFEYYALDENGIKLVVKSTKDNELYDNDTVSVVGMEPNNFIVHVYDNMEPRFQGGF